MGNKAYFDQVTANFKYLDAGGNLQYSDTQNEYQMYFVFTADHRLVSKHRSRGHAVVACEKMNADGHAYYAGITGRDNPCKLAY